MNEQLAGTPSPDDKCCWTQLGLSGPDGVWCELPFNHVGEHTGRDATGQRRKWLVVNKKFVAQ